MPNGLSSAPRYFTKLLKTVYSTLRQQGHLNVGYIDDSYLQGRDYDECALNVSDTAGLFSELGFEITYEKSIMQPVRCLTFLGFILDSVNMIITLTPEKKEKVKSACLQIAKQSEVKVVDLAQVIGTLVSSLPGVQFGCLYYRQLEIEKNLALKANSGNFEALLFLSPKAHSELTWWINNVDQAFNPISHGNPEVEIKTDASKTGWGVHFGNNSSQGLWSTTESQLHINELELKAVYFALKAFADLLDHRHVKVFTDNSTAVHYINAMGGTKSPPCNDIANEIWCFCISRHIWITAAHIAGVENCEADRNQDCSMTELNGL